MPVARFLLALLVAATLLGLNADERLPATKRDKPKDSRSGAAPVATPVTRAPGDPEIALVLVARGLDDPEALAAPNARSGRLFVAERPGRVRIIDGDGVLLDEPFLDVSAEVQTGYFEQGLLGLAFHPEFRTNGRFFVAYAMSAQWRYLYQGVPRQLR